MVKLYDYMHQKSLRWEDFRRAPDSIIRAAERIIKRCEQSAPAQSVDGKNLYVDHIPDEDRFREQFHQPKQHDFGEYWHTFYLPEDLAPPQPTGQGSSSAVANILQRAYATVLPGSNATVVTRSNVTATGGANFAFNGEGVLLELQSRVTDSTRTMAAAVFDVKECPTCGLLADRLDQSTTDSANEMLTHSLRLALDDNLKHACNQSMTRDLTRDLTKSITVNLTDSIVQMLLKTVSDPYVESATRILVHALTPTLTHSCSATISHAMSRAPQNDYFCWYCLNKEAYCDYCQNSASSDHFLDYYNNAFAQYFSEYFRKFYAVEADPLTVMLPGPPFTPNKNETVTPERWTPRKDRGERYQPNTPSFANSDSYAVQPPPPPPRT